MSINWWNYLNMETRLLLERINKAIPNMLTRKSMVGGIPEMLVSGFGFPEEGSHPAIRVINHHNAAPFIRQLSYVVWAASLP